MIFILNLDIIIYFKLKIRSMDDATYLVQPPDIVLF